VAPIDLFKMIDQQFEVVDTVALEDFTFKFAMIVSEMLDDYRIKKQVSEASKACQQLVKHVSS
jgi:hypothetical protein